MKDRVILEKIKTYAAQAIQFKGGMTFEEFSNDLKPYPPVFLILAKSGNW